MDVTATIAPRTSEADDSALMTAVAARDGDAFARLLDRHLGGVHRLAYRMLGDASEAEDVAQETFVRLWDGAQRWRPQGGGVPAWLRRVATNLCFDRLRRRARLTDAVEVDERADPAPLADRTIDRDQLADAAATVLAALPDRQRAAIVLTYYEELTNAEAAAVMELHIKAFESLLLRARTAMRERLTRMGISSADIGEAA